MRSVTHEKWGWVCNLQLQVNLHQQILNYRLAGTNFKLQTDEQKEDQTKPRHQNTQGQHFPGSTINFKKTQKKPKLRNLIKMFQYIPTFSINISESTLSLKLKYDAVGVPYNFQFLMTDSNWLKEQRRIFPLLFSLCSVFWLDWEASMSYREPKSKRKLNKHRFRSFT